MVLWMKGLWCRLRREAEHAVESWRRWRRERRTYTELARLDDRTLEDLGFRRVRLGFDQAVIVPVLDEAALLGSPAASNDNRVARREPSIGARQAA
jgi:hypothetical protein